MFHIHGAVGFGPGDCGKVFFSSFLECTENEESLKVLTQPAEALTRANKWQCMIKNSSSVLIQYKTTFTQCKPPPTCQGSSCMMIGLSTFTPRWDFFVVAFPRAEFSIRIDSAACIGHCCIVKEGEIKSLIHMQIKS